LSKSKLVKDTLLYAIASFGSKAISFLLLPLYTSYFTSEEYGQWDLILTTISLIVPFVSFEIQSAVYRWLLDTKEFEERSKIITTGFIYILKNILISITLLSIILIFYEIEYAVLLLVLIIIMVVNDFILKALRGLEFNKQFALMGVIQTFTIISLNIIFIFVFKLRIVTFFYSFIISYLLVSIIGWLIIDLYKYINLKKYSREISKKFIKYSAPMIPSAINWWIMNVSDRYIILFIIGINANGIYAASNKLPSIIILINSIFFLAWQDNAISSYKNTNRDLYYTEIFKDYSKLMFTGCIFLISSTRIIMHFAVDIKFFDAWKYVGLLYIGTMFSAFSSFWGAGYHGSKETKIIFKTTFIGAIFNIIVNLCLINYIGLYSCAVSTVVGYFIMWIFRVFNKNSDFKIKIEKKSFTFLSVSMILVLYLSFLENTIIDVFSMFFALVLIFIFNKNVIFSISKNMLKKIKT
jgi:O-antigen/teichoic acid export membrane protein